MKRRSHRLPISDPPDDWGDGSWTVDCVCGVTFDDGEEMVNCDECGVWVHTRCSRFVKGETSFACDKCKNKKKRNDSEETEVAQLLVELPTKTLRMNTSYPSSVPSRPSFRLWTDIPMEERVHVQGIPGGDPSLFRGLSSVFTPDLWKCTGYVPKKFNFQYQEFPCWDEKGEADARIEEENENLVDKGAGVLFSLSKEIVSAPAMETSMELRGPFNETGGERNPSPKEMKKREGKDYSIGRMQNSVKRDRDQQLRPAAVHSGKRKKEDFGTFKDRSGMKKVRSSEKVADNKKRGDKEADNKKRASGHFHGAQKLEVSDDGGVKIKTGSFDTKIEDRTEAVLPVSDLEATINTNKTLNASCAKPYATECILSDSCRDTFPSEMESSVEKVDNQARSRNENHLINGGGAMLLLQLNDAGFVESKKEDVKTDVDDPNHLTDGNYDARDVNGGSSSVAVDSQNMKPLASKLLGTTAEVQEYQMLQGSHGYISPISVQSNMKLKVGGSDEHPMESDIPSSPISDVKNDITKFSAISLGRSALAQVSENHQVHDATLGSLSSSDSKPQDNERESKALSHFDRENLDERMVSVSEEPQRLEQELEGSIGPVTVQEGSSEPKCAMKHAEEPVKFGEKQLSPPAQHTQHKVVAGVAKSSSTSSTVVISKLSVSGSCKPVVASTPPRPVPSTKRMKMISNADTRRGHAVSDVVRDDLRHEVAKKTAKENAKDSVLKTQQTSKISQSSLSKRAPTDSKELVSNASSRSPVAQSVAASSGFVESAGALQTQGASHVQSKITASGFSKGEKFSQSSSQPSSKLNNSPSMHPPPPVSSPALSDEELALLLHQELNSSPRVPRVPRARHSLASPAISLVVKRSSGSGSKDQVSRRKNIEDASKDDYRTSREPNDKPEKIDRATSSLDQRRQDPVLTTDGSTSREACERSLELVHSGKKNMPSASTIANSGPSSSTETNDQNLSSIRNSPREIADGDTGTISGHASRTLPGLINLRKHNGEQYASSHSQAVLDCQRNHNEWPQPVDRGPKNNAVRKRQKLDAGPSLTDLEESEVDRGTYPRELEGKSVDSQQEDFPKGKRKARKRRRLALQGRGIKDVRKRQKVGAITDDDFDPFSYSSEGTEGIFSEDESHGARACPVGSEASTGSDEPGLM